MSRTCTDRVKPVRSLEEFFRDSIAQSMRRQGLQACAVTAHYVVNLLTLFARSEALYDDSESRRGLKPLALMLADAVNAPSAVATSGLPAFLTRADVTLEERCPTTLNAAATSAVTCSSLSSSSLRS